MLKIAFLFGAGLSIPARISSTSDITNNVLTGNNVMRHTDGNYYFGKPLYHHIGKEDEYVPRIVKFIERIKVEIDKYYSEIPQRTTNYEDLYYVVSQIYDSEMFNYDNPIVQPFIDKIINDIKPLFEGKEGEIREKWELHELASESMNYIHDIIWHHLGNKPSDFSYLNFLKDAHEDSEIDKIYIYSLNHDLLLEEYFQLCKIPYYDGFGSPINNVKYWDYNFSQSPYKVNFMKLHGSINWFKFSRDGYEKDAIGIPTHWDYWRTKDPSGEYQFPIHGRPMFLVGTFNKILQYTYDIYFLLYYHLYDNLASIDTIIISGYSFGDKGINTRIIEWLHLNRKNKIIVIHPDSETLKNSSRGGILINWDKWVGDKKLNIIQKKIEELSWKELSMFI